MISEQDFGVFIFYHLPKQEPERIVLVHMFQGRGSESLQRNPKSQTLCKASCGILKALGDTKTRRALGCCLLKALFRASARRPY